MKREQLSIYDDHGDDTSARFVVFVFSWLPYLALAWAYMKSTDGSWPDFWIAIGVLFGLRLFFSMVETVAGFFQWWLYGRRFIVHKTLAVFHTNAFPQREPGEDILMYLYRIQRAPDCAAPLRDRTQELEFELIKCRGMGWLNFQYAQKAMQEALERYETPMAKFIVS